MFLPSVLSHPDVVGASAARRSACRNGTVPGGVIRYSAGVSQVSFLICLAKGSNNDLSAVIVHLFLFSGVLDAARSERCAVLFFNKNQGKLLCSQHGESRVYLIKLYYSTVLDSDWSESVFKFFFFYN